MHIIIRFSLYAAYAIYLKYKIPFVITEHNFDILLDKFPNTLKRYTKKELLIIQKTLIQFQL